jgi:hypothetical protein
MMVALLFPLALLSACGDDSASSTATDPADSDSSSATATESASETATPSDSATPTPEPKEPQCDDVWQEGNKLPGGYDGCYDGDRRVKPNGRYCEIGKPLITYKSNWYATPGGPINHTDGPLAQDAGYQSAVRACGG